MAHRMADGDILCNVDADQFIGKGFAQLLIEEFDEAQRHHQRIYMRHDPKGIGADGKHNDTLGKLAIRREDFAALRGYNEEIVGLGGEETNLVARMMLNRIHFKPIPFSYAAGVEHSDEERIAHVAEPAKEVSRTRLDGQNASDRHWVRLAGKAKRFAGHVMNAALNGINPTGFGRGEVFVNFSSTPIELGQIAQTQKDQGQAAVLARV